MGAGADAHDETLDMTDTLRLFPLALTSLEAFVTEQVAKHNQCRPVRDSAVQPLIA